MLLGLSFLPYFYPPHVTHTRRIAGTSMVCSFLEVGLSFAPAKTLKRIFPPIVTGTVILMIGASLIGASGVLNWGGGSNDCHSRSVILYGNKSLH
jgi:xanthine/uracil permease